MSARARALANAALFGAAFVVLLAVAYFATAHTINHIADYITGELS